MVGRRRRRSVIINGFLDAQGEPGTLTSAAYQPAFFTMVGVLAVGFLANLAIRPVDDRFHEPSTSREKVSACMSEQTQPAQSFEPTSTARLVFSWALVSLPLAYGLYETLVKVADLFAS